MIKGECQERCSCMEDTLEVRCVGFTCPPDTFCALADDTLRTCAGKRRTLRTAVLKMNSAAMNCLSHPKDEVCGGAAAPKWYFVPSEGRCQQFSSTGCAGVDNVFNTWSECLWKCLAPRTAGIFTHVHALTHAVNFDLASRFEEMPPAARSRIL